MFQVNVPAVIMPIAMQLVRQTDQYHHFRNVVDTSLGSTIDWHNVAMYFYVTRAAVQMAGTGGAVALKLKDMALKYFSDKFAGWITDRGGWVSYNETDSLINRNKMSGIFIQISYTQSVLVLRVAWQYF